MEARFANDCAIEPGEQGEIESVLRRVTWPHPIAAVTVTRRLAGGRSGAEVLDVLVRKAESAVDARYVVKLGPADEVAQERKAYKNCIEGDTKDEGPLDCWPWAGAVYGTPSLNAARLMSLVSHGDEGVWAALNYVCAHEGLFNGRNSSLFQMELEATRLDALLVSQPTPDDARAPLYAIALCAFGVASQFDYIRAVATDPGHLGNVSEEGFHSYGMIQGSPGGDVLSALGSLGRRADSATAAKVADFLRSFDASPWPPCVRRSRLVALGVMGDWTGLLSELEHGDRVMHGAAVNVVELWVPGHCSPPGGLQAVGAWVVEELERPLAPEVRSTLEKVKDVVESKLRRYVVLGDGKEEGRPPER